VVRNSPFSYWLFFNLVCWTLLSPPLDQQTWAYGMKFVSHLILRNLPCGLSSSGSSVVILELLRSVRYSGWLCKYNPRHWLLSWEVQRRVRSLKYNPQSELRSNAEFNHTGRRICQTSKQGCRNFLTHTSSRLLNDFEPPTRPSSQRWCVVKCIECNSLCQMGYRYDLSNESKTVQGWCSLFCVVIPSA